MRLRPYFALLALIGIGLASSSSSESFSEELLLRPLGNGVDLLAHFRFTTLKTPSGVQQTPSGVQESPTGVPTDAHYHLFPRQMGELLESHRLRELDVTLSRGVWRSRLWGFAPREQAPAGAQVKAWFRPEGEHEAPLDVDSLWTGLTNALSGQLCASLNFLDSSQSVSPRFTFQPSGVVPVPSGASASNTSYFKMGTLPGENVCTENLTPWKKLLPCESKRGLATLLNAAPLHKSKYHSLGLSLRLVCPGNNNNNNNNACASPSVEFTQYVTLVFDPSTDTRDKISWSVRSLFGIGLPSIPCPVADSSHIYVDVTDDLFTLKPETPRGELLEKDGRVLRSYDLNSLLEFGASNLIANYRQPTVYGLIPSPWLHATRYLVGYGQEKGGVVTKIVNAHAQPISVVLLDVLPWYLRTYFHTLDIKSRDLGSHGPDRNLRPLASNFEPGRDRAKPYMMEIVLQLPGRSETRVSLDFEKSILKWLEYPPDANHGFYVGSAVVSAFLPDRRNFTALPRHFSTYNGSFTARPEDFTARPGDFYDTLARIYTETLLVDLPTPDFSMPYNVICLACTVVALAFGPLHNITTKDLGIEEVRQRSLKEKVMGFFRRAKKEEEEKEGKAEEEEHEEKEEQEEEGEENTKKKDKKGKGKEEEKEEGKEKDRKSNKKGKGKGKEVVDENESGKVEDKKKTENSEKVQKARRRPKKTD